MLNVPTLWTAFVVNFLALGLIWAYILYSYPSFVAARHWTARSIEFTRDRDLVPYHDGICLVGPAPESRRWAMAMMSASDT